MKQTSILNKSFKLSLVKIVVLILIIFFFINRNTEPILRFLNHEWFFFCFFIYYFVCIFYTLAIKGLLKLSRKKIKITALIVIVSYLLADEYHWGIFYAEGIIPTISFFTTTSYILLCFVYEAIMLIYNKLNKKRWRFF
jgi:hypothetical protein